ncbi:hypothetical protein BXU11_05265 [Flavobacterium sp. LM5]|nr:hypothetical protein BXU11_05265 [Flavobacterium sp. LM5]
MGLCRSNRTPSVVSCTEPVVPFPIFTVTLVSVVLITVAAVPPTVTTWTVAKLVPFITRVDPMQPFKLDKLVIVGGSTFLIHKPKLIPAPTKPATSVISRTPLLGIQLSVFEGPQI